MAEFVREASSTLTPLEHSRQIWRDSLKLMSIKGLMGKKGSGKPVIVDTTYQNNPGETVRVHFVPFADKNPIRGQDASITGNEYSFDEFSDDVTIDEVNFPFKKRGKMTDQRSILNTRAELSGQVSRHFAQYNEDQIFKIWSGGTTAEALSNLTGDGDETDRVNGANRCIEANGTSGYNILADTASDNKALFASCTAAANDKISPQLIKRASVMARTSTPYKMQPLRVGPNNEEVFLLFVAPQVAYDLTEHPDWIAHALSVPDKGWENDQIARGALGVIHNVIVKESERVIRITDGTNYVARNLLVGGDASLLAWSQTLDYTEQWTDYRRELGVLGTEIRGETRLTFTNKDDSSDSIDYGIAHVITTAD